jgi:transposase-like protein
MSLPRELNNVLLSRSCSRCGSQRQNPGIWFRSIRRYTCAECGGLEVLTYDEKVKLFAKAHLMRLTGG